jgi:hypothetical protein
MQLGTTQYSITVDTEPKLPATFDVKVFPILFATRYWD